MTIPIQPGPFSFLKTVGEAAGAYANAKETKRKTALEEAQDKARTMVALRAAGIMSPKQFESPEVQAVFHMAGFGPVSSDMTSAEQLEYGKREALPQVISRGNEDERRSLLGLPERGLTQKIDAGIAQNIANVPTAQLQGATSAAQLPEAEATAVAGQQSTQDKTFDTIADRVVETLYARNGRLPTPESAFTFGLADARAQAFGERINLPYYGRAIERLRARLEDEKTKRLGAQARYAGATGTGLDDYLRILQGQQTRITAELNAIPKPGDSDFRLADLAAQNRSKGKPVPPIIQQAESRVIEYNRRVNELQQQQQQVREQLDRALGNQKVTPGTTPPGASGSPQKRAAAQEYENRTRGITDPAQRKRIADEIARKYNIAPQSQQPYGAGGKF